MINAQRTTASTLFTAAMTNSATQTANLDTRGASYATVYLTFAVETDAATVGPTISLSTSDDTVVTNFATITADRTAEDISAAKTLAYFVDLKGQKRYLRLSVTTATTTNDNVTVGAIGVLSREGLAPTQASEMADAAVIV